MNREGPHHSRPQPPYRPLSLAQLHPLATEAAEHSARSSRPSYRTALTIAVIAFVLIVAAGIGVVWQDSPAADAGRLSPRPPATCGGAR